MKSLCKQNEYASDVLEKAASDAWRVIGWEETEVIRKEFHKYDKKED